MPKQWIKAGAPIQTRITELIKDHYKDLQEAKISVQALFADGGEDEAGGAIAALMHEGLPVAAQIKKTTVIERICGMADAVMQVDERVWNELDQASESALLDHELNHLVLEKDKDGILKCDAAKRPVITLRHHDVTLGIFHTIVKRYGMDSIDARVIDDLYNTPSGQMVFDLSHAGSNIKPAKSKATKKAAA